jgi:hypothetical protein
MALQQNIVQIGLHGAEGRGALQVLIKTLMAVIGLEGCGPSQPLKPLWALFPRQTPFSTSGISGTPPGYAGRAPQRRPSQQEKNAMNAYTIHVNDIHAYHFKPESCYLYA